MRKIFFVLLSIILITTLTGCSSTKNKNYQCPKDNTLNCTGGGAPGSDCRDNNYIKWLTNDNNCPGVKILE